MPVRRGKDSAAPYRRGGAHAFGSSSRFRRKNGPASRSAAAALCTAAVIPLVVLQIPDAVAWAVSARLGGAGPDAVASLLRACGLALPAMAVAAPLAALAVRRLRPGPVLLAGLLVIAAADMFGDAARTVVLIGVDRSLHGLGAGIAMAAMVAAVEGVEGREPSLVGWWAAVTVAGLAAAPRLMRQRVGSGSWPAALQPYPWLTGTALALAALYALLAEGTAADARSAFPAAERARLGLLAAPVAGMCAIAVAVTYQGGEAVIAAAIAAALALAGIAAISARTGSAARFAVVCAVAGFTLAPAVGAVTALTRSAAQAGAAALAAALCGAALALMTRRPHARVMTTAGLLLAAAGFGALYLAGPPYPQGRTLALLCVPLAGGLAAALAVSLRGTPTAGALAGVVILLAGVVAGYLAAAAVQLRALAGERTVPAAQTAQAVHGALVTAAGRLALVAAAVTAVAALALAGPPQRRARGTPDRG